MEPDGPLRQSQAPANCPYPQPDQSSSFPLSCHFLKIYFIIILSSMPRSSKCLLPIRSPHQNPVCTYPVSRTCHMPSPSHFSWFDYPNNIWWAVQIIKLLIMYFPPLSCYLVTLSSTPYSQTPSAYVPPSTWATKFYTHTKQKEKLQFCISWYLYF